ncbi:MAG: methyl-accepting chemotaxis protein [Firmicutes bacterium]|nr:methyl-accepting chemotaxis protein [Bacillota bacterium]
MKHLKLSRKLIIGFALVLILSTVVAWVSFMYMEQLAESTDGLFNQPYTIHTSALSIQRNIIAIDREMKDIIRITGRDAINEHAVVIDQYDAEILEQFEILYDRMPENAHVLDNAMQVISDWKPIRDEIIRLQRLGRMYDSVTLAKESSDPQVLLIEEAIQVVVDLAKESAIEFNTTAQEDAASARQIVLNVMVLAYIVAFIAIAIVTRSIAKPIRRLVAFAQEIAQGNLGVDAIGFTGRDEIGTLAKALDEMRASLRNMASAVTEAVEAVSSSAEQMSMATKDTTAAVEDLAHSANQFAGAADQLSSSTDDMSQSAQKTNELSVQGEVEIKRTIASMAEIDSVVNSLANSISDLGEHSEEIGSIVTLITGIADQTNLLALNAAIEAARAGEQGRGFAVVADEVRKLAEQSARAAGEITELVAEIRQSTMDSVKHAKTGTDKVKEGMDAVTKTGQVFGDISAIISNLVGEISTIASASQELAAGAQQMGATTEQQAAATQQIASGAQHVVEAAETVKEQMSRFRL